MSIDAVAVLRIHGLEPPSTPFGDHPVDHIGDATLLNLQARWDGADPDEHALALRTLVGDALDAHRDPRGILMFPDVSYPRGQTYAAIVQELEAGGIWVQLVDSDYIPKRFRGSPREPHDELVGQIIEVMGRDAGLELDMMARVSKMLALAVPERENLQSMDEKLRTISDLLGEDFADAYNESLRKLAGS